MMLAPGWVMAIGRDALYQALRRKSKSQPSSACSTLRRYRLA
jgi:hypothetical protein